MRLATAKRLMKLPDIKCEAPLVELDVAPAEVAESVADPLSEEESDVELAEEAPEAAESVATPLPEEELGAALAEGAPAAADAVATPLTERAASVAPATPLTMDPEGFWPGAGAVALVAMAACWNASKLFAAVGLMAKTIPI